MAELLECLLCGYKTVRCEICDSTESLQAHHPDYTFPSIVVTLCRSCHMWVDKGVLVIEQ